MDVSDLMTRDVVSMKVTDSVLSAATLLAKYTFDGLPVVDDKGILVGLVTQADLSTKISHIHIPTLLSLLAEFDLYRKDKKFIAGQMEKIEGLTVGDVMNHEPPLLYEGATVDEAIMHLSRTHGINPTSVVNKSRMLVGVVTRFDLMKRFGATSGAVPTSPASTIVDEKVDGFLKEFAKNYLFVSRARTTLWLITNIVFLVVGAIAAVVLFW